MAVSTEGLVPITRKFLASYYDKYPFQPLSDDVSHVSSQIRTSALDLIHHSPPPSQDEGLLVEEAEHTPPHKLDENMWKNREHIEEVLFLLDKSNWPAALKQPSTPDISEFVASLEQLRDKLCNTLKIVESFQVHNSERV